MSADSILRDPSPRDRSPEGLDPQEEVRAVTLHIFDWLFPLAVVFGGLALVVATWRNLEFTSRGTIAVYAGFLLVLVTALGLRRRIPLAIVSALFCGVGIADAVVGLFTYGFVGAGVLLLCVSTISAGVLFGLRGGLFALGIGLGALGIAAWVMCSGGLSVPFDPIAYLSSPSAWMVHIVHYTLLTLFAVVMVHAMKARLFASLQALRERTTELTLANRVLAAEIAARRRAEGELSESEQQYRLLSQQMNDAVAHHDMDLRIHYASPSVERMFGYTPEEARRLSLEQLLAPESLARTVAAFHKYAALAKDHDVQVPLAEYEYRRKDGSTFWGELGARFLRDQHGQLTGSVVVVRDVSERRRAQAEKERLQEQLRQSEKLRLLGQLAGGIAHDFNNQLAGIMGYAELLGAESKGRGIAGDAAKMILQCAQRSGELTSKLLAFARKGTYQSIPVDMHALVREVAAILEHSIDKTVTVAMDLHAQHAMVIGDPTQLQSALLNLAINARDAMPQGGVLRFASTVVDAATATSAGAGAALASEDYLQLEVEDTGVGMDAETLVHIFEPFFTTKGPGGGTGLGLAAVLGSVIAHHGTVTARSQPGQGATFTIYLPLSAPAEVSAPTQPCVVAGGSGRILVVDDEPAIRRVLHSHLSSEGYDVVTAADGVEAVELFQQASHTFDLVLLDLVLPRKDGSSVFAEIRSIDPDARVLLMSGHGEDLMVSALIQRGAISILRKPFTLAELSSRIAASLRQPSTAEGQT